MNPTYNINDRVYYIDDEKLEINEYSIQGIQKTDSSYQTSPEYVYNLESLMYLKYRNLQNEYIRVMENEIYSSKSEANKALNRLKDNRKKQLKAELERL